LYGSGSNLKKKSKSASQGLVLLTTNGSIKALQQRAERTETLPLLMPASVKADCNAKVTTPPPSQRKLKD
jgi:hypothetical protein